MPTKWVERGAASVARFSRGTKVAVAIATDAAAAPALLFIALVLRRGSVEAALQVSPTIFALVSVASVGIFAAMGMYRAIFRFIAHGGPVTAALGVLLSTFLLGLANYSFLAEPIKANSIVIFAALSLLYLVVSRSLVRELLSYRRGSKERVVIYGAGSAGAQLIRALRESGHFVPVAFVDDDPLLQRKTVAGINVYAPKHLPSFVKRKEVTAVLLAIPSCSRRQRQCILKSLEPLPVRVRMVPQIDDIVSGRATIADLRDVDAEDLLGRDPVAPNHKLLGRCIRSKVVLVSGAGGSIGSELCRQIVQLGPRRLVLLELSEPALYHIERELRDVIARQSMPVELVGLLGNAMDRARVQELMRTYSIETVYHAAAYKHVPIVEHNVIEGVRNNIFATYRMAEAALQCGVETFVLISTDKAVNPTNVMGATKRLAELTLQALQERSSSTRFCMVRFGNVLESSGSVVPLFREQIQRGGPVTVTHKDIIRYFMTIPEASQLVLQAGAMARGGEVFVLDMGEPVRIVDLAKRMIHLMGATFRDESNPDGDIEIVFTGLRPAEKLFEELLIGSNVSGTHHPMIMQAHEPHVPWADMQGILQRLTSALDALDCAVARDLIMQTVAEYRPNSGIQDLVWQRKRKTDNPLDRVSGLSVHRVRPEGEVVAAAQ